MKVMQLLIGNTWEVQSSCVDAGWDKVDQHDFTPGRFKPAGRAGLSNHRIWNENETSLYRKFKFSMSNWGQLVSATELLIGSSRCMSTDCTRQPHVVSHSSENIFILIPLHTTTTFEPLRLTISYMNSDLSTDSISFLRYFMEELTCREYFHILYLTRPPENHEYLVTTVLIFSSWQTELSMQQFVGNSLSLAAILLEVQSCQANSVFTELLYGALCVPA
jgi:hypothetical protein